MSIYLTIEETAGELRLSPATVRRLIDQRVIPSVTIRTAKSESGRGAVRVPRAELEKLALGIEANASGQRVLGVAA